MTLRVIPYQVLILVLVEDGLGDDESLGGPKSDQRVLILVLVEDGLGEIQSTL